MNGMRRIHPLPLLLHLLKVMLLLWQFDKWLTLSDVSCLEEDNNAGLEGESNREGGELEELGDEGSMTMYI